MQGHVFRPPANGSAEYNITFMYGEQLSPARRPYDTDTARFWEDGNTTSAIGGHWAQIAMQVLPRNYTTEQTALFFARFGAALYDARCGDMACLAACVGGLELSLVQVCKARFCCST